MLLGPSSAEAEQSTFPFPVSPAGGSGTGSPLVRPSNDRNSCSSILIREWSCSTSGGHGIDHLDKFLLDLE